MATNDTHNKQGRHGDAKGHAKAGEQSSGKFKSGDQRTQKAAQAGGEARGEQMKESSRSNSKNTNDQR
jgi:hypothetical protein